MAKKRKPREIFSDKKLNEFGSDYIKTLTKYIRKAGKKATGKLLRSLNYKIEEDAEEIRIILESEDYLEYIDKGRKPGSYPPINEIAKWAKVKGISQKAVFPIARSIYRFGIKPTNIIEKTIREITSPSHIKDIETEVADNMEELIKLTLESNNK